MSRRILTRAVLAVAVIVVVLLLVTPALVGGRIQTATVDSLLDRVPAEASSVMDITQTDFQRGWFGSTARLELRVEELDTLLGEPVTLILDLAIDHGPVLFTPGGLRLGVAFSEIDPELTGLDLQQFDLQAVTEYTRPLFYLFAGFDNTVELGLDLDRLQSGIAGMGLELEDLRGFTVVNADLSGTGNVDLDRLSFHASDRQVDLYLQNLSFQASEADVTSALSTGQSRVAIDEIGSTSPLPLTLRRVSAEFELREDLQSSQRLIFSQAFRIAEFDGDLPLDSVALESRLGGLSRPLLENYVKLIDQYQRGTAIAPGQPDPGLENLSQDLLLDLARESVDLDVSLNADAFGGAHRVTLTVDWPGLPTLTSLDTINMQEVIRAVSVDLVVDADQAALMNSPLAQAVSGYARQGLLEVANGRVRAEASLADGILRVNQETLPIDQLINLQ